MDSIKNKINFLRKTMYYIKKQDEFLVKKNMDYIKNKMNFWGKNMDYINNNMNFWGKTKDYTKTR